MLKIMEAFSNASENCEVGLAVKASYLSECQMKMRGERQREERHKTGAKDEDEHLPSK